MKFNIYPIRMGFNTVYVVKGEGAILIDGGNPGKLVSFKSGLARASIQPEEIKLIVLTHGHWDHTGSTADIKQLTVARVLMHRKDMHFLSEARPSSPPGFTLWGKIASSSLRFISSSIHVPPFDADTIIEDEELSLSEYGIPGRLIHTPGHTWSSLSVLMESGDVFAGDLAMNSFPLTLRPRLPIIGDDGQLVKESWKKLLERGAKTVYPAHGKPFPAQVIRNLIT